MLTRRWPHRSVCFRALTHHPAVVSTVVEQQLLLRVDLCGRAEEEFTVGGIRHQILLFVGPEQNKGVVVFSFLAQRFLNRNHAEQ